MKDVREEVSPRFSTTTPKGRPRIRITTTLTIHTPTKTGRFPPFFSILSRY